ncbi:MAG: porin family protein [Psychrobium sp.]|nr:porin family protein [Psychrobium sp.]
MKKIAFATALLLSINVANAADSPKWNKVSVSYLSSNIDDYSLTGLGVEATKLLSDNIFAVGKYSNLSDDVSIFGADVEINAKHVSVGVGYVYALAPETDVYAVLSYESATLKAAYRTSSSEYSENGFGIGIGARHAYSKTLEIAGAMNYISIDNETQTAYQISALYHFTPNWSAGISYQRADEMDGIALSAVLFF